MADLQKMPGGAGLLKKQEAKQKTKERGSVSAVVTVQNKQACACAEVLCSPVRSGRRVLGERPEGIQSGRLAD